MTWSRAARPGPPPSPPPGGPFWDYGPALPEAYGVTRVWALVRDPECLLATWEGGEALRVYDRTAGTVREVRVASVGTWYFGAEPEHEYEVELLSGGRVVAVSGRVRMPRRAPAAWVDSEWVPGEGPEEVRRRLLGILEPWRHGSAGGEGRMSS